MNSTTKVMKGSCWANAEKMLQWIKKDNLIKKTTLATSAMPISTIVPSFARPEGRCTCMVRGSSLYFIKY